MAELLEEVRIITDTRLSNDKIAVFIATAQLLVDEELSESKLSEARLKEITKYLAAHFLVTTDELGALKAVKIGEVETNIQPAIVLNPTQGLTSTRFGIQALLLDTSNTLRNVFRVGKVKARFTVL